MSYIPYDYEVKNHVIVSPGKFEGEADYIPDFWGRSLDGEHDREIEIGTNTWYIFVFTDVEKLVFPDDYGIALCEDDQGFVHSAILRIEDDIFEL